MGVRQMDRHVSALQGEGAKEKIHVKEEKEICKDLKLSLVKSQRQKGASPDTAFLL